MVAQAGADSYAATAALGVEAKRATPAPTISAIPMRRRADVRPPNLAVMAPNLRLSLGRLLPAGQLFVAGYDVRSMSGPTPYILFPGTAREALTFYGEVFGCAVELHTFAEFGRTDGPADAIAHGELRGGPVSVSGADVSGDDRPVRIEGMMLSLLGTADPKTLRSWFVRLGEGGSVVDDLQKRPWGASDGQVIDRFGLHWLIGFEGEEGD